LNLGEVLSPLRQIDSAQLAPLPQLTAGWVPLIFAAGSLLVYVFGPKRYSFTTTFALAGFAVLATVLIFASGLVWLLGPAGIFLAIGGAGLLNLQERLPALPQHLLLPVLILIVVAASLPIWLPPHWDESPFDSAPLAQIRYEQQAQSAAVLPVGWPVPSTVAPDLEMNRMLINSYQTGALRKVLPDAGLERAQVNVISQETHSQRLQVLSDRAFQLPYLTAYFPGWQAVLNSITLEVSADPRTGLLLIDVPSTRSGELVLSLGSTAVRTSAWLISLAALLLSLIVTRIRYRRQPDVPFYDALNLLQPQETRLVMLLLACFSLVLLLTAPIGAPLNLRAAPAYHLQDAAVARTQTDVGLELLAYRMSTPDRRHLLPGDSLELSLYWRMLQFLPENYLVTVFLQDVNRRTRWEQSEARHPGGYPTRLWSLNGYVSDPYRLTLPDDLLPGSYQVGVEVFRCVQTNCTSTERITFFDRSQQPGRQTLLLPQVLNVTR
jgi:hypothetical protein